MKKKVPVISNGKFKSRAVNLSLMCISTLIALIVVELTLRVVAPHDLFMSLVPVEKKAVVEIHSSFYEGVDSVSYQSVNALGYRSPSLFASHREGILTIGASTTYCIGLSDEDSWPWLLEGKLNKQGTKQYTVGNVGVSAFNSRHNYFQLKHLEPQFENVNTVIMLMGINDYMRKLYRSSEYVPTNKDDHSFARSFIRLPRSSGENWVERTELWMHFRDLKNHVLNNKAALNQKKIYEEKIKAYHTAEKLETLPDLNDALQDYEINLRTIAQRSKERGLRMIWLTQPVLWFDNMSAHLEQLAFFHSTNIDGKVYSSQTLADGMQIFNDLLVEVAKEENIELIDLASKLPKNEIFFFDYCHYTKEGTELVAQIIFDTLNPVQE